MRSARMACGSTAFRWPTGKVCCRTRRWAGNCSPNSQLERSPASTWWMHAFEHQANLHPPTHSAVHCSSKALIEGAKQMPTPKDPLLNCRFRVEIDGINQAGFSEVFFADTIVELVEYREGND